MNIDTKNLEEHFGRLCERYRPLMVRQCMLHSHGRCVLFDDLMQEVRLALWTDMPAFTDRMPQWKEYMRVYFLTRKTLQQYRRRMAGHPATVPLDDNLPVSLVEENRAEELIDELSAYLSDDDRRMVVLLCQGYSLGETAERMGLMYDAARKRLQRIKQELCEIYKKIHENGNQD